MELQNVKSLAVFKMRNIGDVLMITPVLRALRETFPEARITTVVNSGTEAMLAENPHIDEVLVFQRDQSKSGPIRGLCYELGFLRELRKRHFDLTIGFTDGDRSAWYAFFCGARYRFGSIHHSVSKYDPRQRIYNRLISSASPPMHEVEKHFYQLEQAGLKLRTTTPGDLCLVIPDDLSAWARKELAPLRPAPIIQVHPVSRWLWKCWSNEAMAQVIDWLELERGARVVLTTGPALRERERAKEIVQLCKSKPLFYDGTLSLSQTAALSAQSQGFFGVDTAPMHMAAAVGVPVIGLFGPTNPVTWGPWASRKIVLSRPCLCNETASRACSWDEVRACLAAITVDDAKAALEQIVPELKLNSGAR